MLGGDLGEGVVRKAAVPRVVDRVRNNGGTESCGWQVAGCWCEAAAMLELRAALALSQRLSTPHRLSVSPPVGHITLLGTTLVLL